MYETIKMVDGWSVQHNGDFSGDVVVQQEGSCIVEFSVPFEVLKCVVAEYVRRERIARIEKATDDDLLIQEA